MSGARLPALRPCDAGALSRPKAARCFWTRSATCHLTCIAATHQDLEQRVKDGSFREDLFHRLNVIRLRLPRLTGRREDIPMLTRHFLQQSARELGVEPKRISDAAVARLGTFSFPGNVRQLENICYWLTVMTPAQVIETKDLPPEVLAGGVPCCVSCTQPGVGG